MQTVRQGEIGKPFVISVAIDLTGATIDKLRFIDPQGVSVDKATGLSVLGPATDGKIAWTDATGMFPDPADVGFWRVVAHVTKGGIQHQSKSAGVFRVIKANA